MMWPSSQISKILTLLLLLVLIYCCAMDALMYLRIQNYKIDIFESGSSNTTKESSTELSVTSSRNYEEDTIVPCTINPLCHPTVKALMVDHVNHYIYGPLCALLDIGLGISKTMPYLTPNMISVFHVFIALVGAKLVMINSLAVRRLGIVLFQIRMFLDDLDGHVARERKHIKGERSEVGTLGYWVDGICDLLGVIAVYVGILLFLKNNPPRRGYKGTTATTLPYHQLKEINTCDDMEKESDSGISYKTKVPYPRIVQVMGLFAGQMLLSSLAWNRYIDYYQELLENCQSCDVRKREAVFESGFFFISTGLWRVVNPHCYLHLMSLAVFCDKTWMFFRRTHFAGYLGLIVAVIVSEFTVYHVRQFVVYGAVL